MALEQAGGEGVPRSSTGRRWRYSAGPKRALDVVAASAALAALSPVLLVIGVAVQLDSPGSALYRARRAGRGGVEFTMYKFRTMHVNRSADAARITRKRDPRITRVGALLRRSKLDELPQLVNVIIGDMSLVGPRPEDPHYLTRYTAEQRRVLEARPGITSLASVRFREEAELLVGADWETTYVARVLPAKLAIDLEYVDHQSLLLDLRVLWATARALVPSW